MTSTRLPGKVLMTIKNVSVLEIMLKRVLQCREINQLVVATTINREDDPIVDLCSFLGVAVFRGDEHDVLKRYYEAALKLKLENIVRLTSDCPMIDPDVTDEVVRKYKSGNCDYVSNCDIRSYPDGLDTEVFTFAALKSAHDNARNPVLREGVTPYIRGNYPELEKADFKKADHVFSADFSHIRWTLDTQQDFEFLTRLISQLPDNYRWLQALSVMTKMPEFLQARQSG